MSENNISCDNVAPGFAAETEAALDQHALGIFQEALTELAGLEARATPGPWRKCWSKQASGSCGLVMTCCNEGDRDFVIAFRNWASTLLRHAGELIAWEQTRATQGRTLYSALAQLGREIRMRRELQRALAEERARCERLEGTTDRKFWVGLCCGALFSLGLALAVVLLRR